MKKWIRWPGLIGFAVVVTVSVALWLLFVDGIVKRIVEKAGTAMTGAEVDLERAHVTLVPLSVTLSGLQATDPAAPEKNSIEISRIAFSLDSMNLLRRKVIINEMSAERMRFGTVRQRPGTVVQPPPPPPAKEETQALPSFTIPDVKSVLQKEKLEAPAIIDGAQEELKKKNDAWQQQVASMPDKAALDAYQARAQKLRESKKGGLRGLAGGLSDAKSLVADMQRDLDRVKKAKADLSADLAAAKSLVAKAEQAPGEDIRRIRDKYSISAEGLQNLSQALFGGEVRGWVRTGTLWYGRLRPLFERASEKKGKVEVAKPLRGRGVDVRFHEDRPLPGFLIRLVKASLQPESGSFTGTVRDITPDQAVLGKPLAFSFAGSGLGYAQAIDLDGTLDHRKAGLPDDQVQADVRGYRVKDLALSTAASLPVSLQEGTVDLEVKGRRGAKTVSARCVARVKGARLSTGGDNSGGAFASAIRLSLAKVSSFTLNVEVTGAPEDYRVSVSSDLDRVLRDAAGSVVREHRDRLEKELKKAVQEMTDTKLAGLKAGLGGLNAQASKLDAVQERLNSMIKEASAPAAGKIRLR